MRNKRKLKCKKGFTLIEALVLLFIFSVMTVTFYKVFASGTSLILETKKRLAAIGVVNERMELIRSLAYEEIGTDGGVPGGNINSDEYIASGNYQFHVITDIRYFDDEEDGTEGGSPDDDTPNDYKFVSVMALWGEETDGQKVSLSSSIAPFGTEEAVSGGTLSISVIDIDGAPVSSAAVNIANGSVVPAINQTFIAGNGSVSIPALPVSEQKYVVTVSKSGYENVSTFPPYPTSAYYPTDVHNSVVGGMITNSVIVASKLSDIEIRFRNAYGESIGNVNFGLEGGRVLGTDDVGALVYNYNEALESDGSGVKSISNISPGQYTVSVSESGYHFWKTDAGIGNEAGEIIVGQGESGAVKNIILLDESKDSYFLRVTDSVTGKSIENASVKLSNIALVYEETVDTDEYGYVFFPDALSKELIGGEIYDVEITADGYNAENTTVEINQLVTGGISLSP